MKAIVHGNEDDDFKYYKNNETFTRCNGRTVPLALAQFYLAILNDK